jgi:hypothetical protein
LLGDVSKARELFPEQMSSLSDERLTEIYRSVCGTDEQAEEETKRDESCISEEGFTRISPQLVVSRRYRQRRINKEHDKEYNIEALHKKNHSVHCVSPLRIYFSAWVKRGNECGTHAAKGKLFHNRCSKRAVFIKIFRLHAFG